MDISIVIPLHNEVDNIRPLHDELKAVLEPLGKAYEIVFVNDGSTDKTLKILKQCRSENDRVKIIDFSRNYGQTPAIMAGFEYAKGAYIITMDGDLQNDPKDIPTMITKLENNYDLVCGWRKNRKDNYLLRIAPSILANKLISLVLKTRIHDYGCTLKAYKNDVVKNMSLYGEMHRFIPAIAAWNGARICELPVNHRLREHEKSKYGFNRVTRVSLDLLLMVFLSEYRTKPIRFFGGLGIMSCLLSFVSLFILVFMKVVRGVDMTGNPLLILCVLFLLVSVQFLSMGFLGEINIRTYYESQNKKTYHIKEVI